MPFYKFLGQAPGKLAFSKLFTFLQEISVVYELYQI